MVNFNPRFQEQSSERRIEHILCSVVTSCAHMWSCRSNRLCAQNGDVYIFSRCNAAIIELKALTLLWTPRWMVIMTPSHVSVRNLTSRFSPHFFKTPICSHCFISGPLPKNLTDSLKSRRLRASNLLRTRHFISLQGHHKGCTSSLLYSALDISFT